MSDKEILDGAPARRFIQLTTAFIHSEATGQSVLFLYALDNLGQVWVSDRTVQDSSTNNWKPLPPCPQNPKGMVMG
jgi:hypothetical protein